LYDKTVRRRRAVLIVLVVLSLLLLTAYFGEAPSGRLHGVQRAFLTIVSPIQDGANKALKPVRDLFGGISDTFHAKSQRNELRKQYDKLRREFVADQAEKREYRQLLSLYRLDRLGTSQYSPVTATVIAKSPNLWYSTVWIDKGEAAGVHRNDPVINGEGLVGRVAQVASGASVVDLITDSTMGVSARVGTSNATGIVQPKVGDPKDLLMQYLPANSNAQKGEWVVTSGSLAPGSLDESLYPPGILIGQVTSVDEESAYKSVNVQPAANLQNLDIVQVLTAARGSRPANLRSAVSALSSAQAATPSGGGEQLASTGGGG